MSDIRAAELPEFQSWSRQFEPPADTSAYLAQEVTVAAATILSELFCPELLAVRDCIILASRYEPTNFERWWEQTAGDHTAVERALNHVHLWDLFEPSGKQEEQALEAISRRLAQTWRCTAETSFPDRSFEVSVTNEYGPTVVMNSRRQVEQL